MSAEKIIGLLIVVVVLVVGIVAFSLFDADEDVELDPYETESPEVDEGEAIADIPDPVARDEGDDPLTREKIAPRNTGATGDTAAAGEVTGRVLDKKNRPVQGARVALCSSMGIFMSFPSAQNELGVDDMTDSQGNYVLSGLSPGREYALLVVHPDFADTSKSPVAVRPGARVELADIIMNDGLIVKGLVTNEGGGPVPGAVVRLLDPSAGSFFSNAVEVKVMAEAKVNAAGAYQFECVSTQNFEVEVTAEGYGTQSKRSTSLEAKHVNEIDFVLGIGMHLSGMIIDEEKRPIEGASVVATKARSRKFSSSGSTLSGADGSFRISGIAKGPYVIRVTRDGFSPGTRQRIEAGTDDIEITLKPQGSVAGFVRDQKTSAPIKSFTVEVYRYRPGKPQYKTGVKEAIQSTDGSFKVENIDPGTYVLEVKAKNYASCKSDKFLVERGKVHEGVDVFMNEGGILKGRVFDGRGKPIKGVSVVLRFNNFADVDIFGFAATHEPGEQGDSGSTAVTDAKGHFVKKYITPGTYQVHFRHHDYTSVARDDVTVFEGRDAAVDMGMITMSGGGTIKGKTLDPSGAEMPGAVVVLSRENGFQKQTISDKDACFEFKHLEPGQYSVTIQADPASTGENTGEDINIFTQLFAAEKSKIAVSVGEGKVENVVIRLIP